MFILIAGLVLMALCLWPCLNGHAGFTTIDTDRRAVAHADYSELLKAV